MDVDSTPSPPFVDRPWPQREPGNSPLNGSRILVVAHELDRSRALAGELARLGSSSLAVCHPDQVDEALGATAGPWFLGGESPSIVDLQYV